LYLYAIQRQQLKLKKAKPAAINLNGRLTHSLKELVLKIEHDSEESLSLLFIFENKNGSKFNYPKNFIRSGQPLNFDDRKYAFEGPIKSISIISEIDIALTIN
jgi:hypothetical protein